MDYFRAKRYLDALPDWEVGRAAVGPLAHYLPRMRALLSRLGEPHSQIVQCRSARPLRCVVFVHDGPALTAQAATVPHRRETARAQTLADGHWPAGSRPGRQHSITPTTIQIAMAAIYASSSMTVRWIERMQPHLLSGRNAHLSNAELAANRLWPRSSASLSPEPLWR